jgi:hypothetical protein
MFLNLYYENLLNQTKRLSMHKYVMGEVESYPLYLFTPLLNKGYNFLIASGFHGDEQAGPLGILAFLMNQNSDDNLNYALLPIANPTGLINNTRYNIDGGNPNRGYEKSQVERTKDAKISQEGIIIKNNLNLLLDHSKLGCIALHEDPDLEEFYLYSTMSNNGRNASICEELKDEVVKFGCKITKNKSILGDKVEDGIIYNCYDGSFEHMLVNNSVPLVITVEVPGKFGDLEARMILTKKLIERFRAAI